MKNKIAFFNCIPAALLTESLGLSKSDLILRAMRKHIHFYYANKTPKNLKYITLTDSIKLGKSWPYKLFGLIPNGLIETLFVDKGEMIEFSKPVQFDLLGKGVLSETEMFFMHPYKKQSHIVLFENKRDKKHKPRFEPVFFQDILVTSEDAIKLIETLKQEEDELKEEQNTEDNTNSITKRETKQSKRERIFVTWLQDKNELTVSNMKKENVLEELRQIDPHLFMGDQKHFFRRQKIIEFKPGRKSELED